MNTKTLKVQLFEQDDTHPLLLSYKGSELKLTREEAVELVRKTNHMLDCLEAYKERNDEQSVSELKYNGCGCNEGECCHEIIKERCPYCRKHLILVTKNGMKYCPANDLYCDYEDFSGMVKE